MTKNVRKRRIKNLLALSLCSLCALFGLTILGWILFDVAVEGWKALSPKLFLKDPAPPGVMGGGGLKSAFLGQGLMTLTAAVMGIPIGILGGTFLAEYGRNLKVSAIVANLSDLAASTPSIVIGAFVHALLVAPFGGFSGWAGSVALAIIIIPLVLRTTDETLRLVPWNLREAALSLGASYHQVIWSIIYRSSLSGLLTGVVLALARAAGETAPLLFTSFNNNSFNWSLSSPTASLTVSIYQYAASPYESWIKLAWAAALVVTVLNLGLNLTARLFLKSRKY
ncbi:MAG: phosphate ABC transporter permease PstA [Deltaproteobacteria bacterium]|nr:phosphate ABC transporter permease PstA [Deltaproteobacteria bacterium]